MMSSLTAPLMMDGVRLNSVSPGATDTDMVAGMLPEGGIYVSDRCLDRARLVSC